MERHGPSRIDWEFERGSSHLNLPHPYGYIWPFEYIAMGPSVAQQKKVGSSVKLESH